MVAGVVFLVALIGLVAILTGAAVLWKGRSATGDAAEPVMASRPAPRDPDPDLEAWPLLGTNPSAAGTDPAPAPLLARVPVPGPTASSVAAPPPDEAAEDRPGRVDEAVAADTVAEDHPPLVADGAAHEAATAGQGAPAFEEGSTAGVSDAGWGTTPRGWGAGRPAPTEHLSVRRRGTPLDEDDAPGPEAGPSPTPGVIDLRDRPDTEPAPLAATAADPAGPPVPALRIQPTPSAAVRRSVGALSRRIDESLDQLTMPHDTTVLAFLFAREVDLVEGDGRAWLHEQVSAEAIVTPAAAVGPRAWEPVGSTVRLGEVEALDDRLLGQVLAEVESAVVDNLDALDFRVSSAPPALPFLERAARRIGTDVGDFFAASPVDRARDATAVVVLVAPEVSVGEGPVVRLVGVSVSDEIEPGRVLSRVTRVARATTVPATAILEAGTTASGDRA